MAQWRNTTQELAPLDYAPREDGYDIYPAFPVTALSVGFGALAKAIAGERQVRVDGYVGVFWEDLRKALDAELSKLGVRATWIDARRAMRSEGEIDRLAGPFLGGDDPLFGTRFTGTLSDFFDAGKLASLKPTSPLTVLYGCGAGLADWPGPLLYVDLPKNELQFRSRAGTVTNLGASRPQPPKPMYKRFYFVDWPALNGHKAKILPRIDFFVDGQRPEAPAIVRGSELRAALRRMSRNCFRVRPWFEPGPWGGQWIKEKIPQLPREAHNYAWSFELISPENGLMVHDGRTLLEVSFDWLMFQESEAVLGAAAGRFGGEFPIRFDFLDTFDGGNLSVQVHPRPEYIRKNFGENFTQDETYYILDTRPGAQVNLGFRQGVDPKAFRRELERSFRDGKAAAIDAFVNQEPARKHDLLLIPNGTIHGSGVNNLVLEISATPYIFTFKMYDWMRPDLDGKPRPLNLDRAFDNLCYDRQGKRIREEFVSWPREIAKGDSWRLVHLPTHAAQFYDVHRYEFAREVSASTEGACHVMSLVEGSSVVLETAGGMRQRFHYAETFIVPAAAGGYRLLNEGSEPAMVVKAFVKPDCAKGE